VGPIPADEARELAADGSWRAWITDAATGQVIDAGRRSYTPSAALARLIRAREPYCRMPGVRREALVDRVEVKDLRLIPVAAGL